MVKKMYAVSAVSLILFFTFWGIFLGTKTDIFFTLGIIALTTCYHFTVRLVIGSIVDYNLKNTVDYTRKWFKQRDFEERLYKNLHVKKWKDSMPTADENLFLLSKHTLEKIISAGCQAEIVHELCAAAGLLAIFLAIPFGDLWVFLVTSLGAALYDLMFVAIQRYNRPHLIKTLKKQQERALKKLRAKENQNALKSDLESEGNDD